MLEPAVRSRCSGTSRLSAPIVVLATLSAVAVVVVIVFTSAPVAAGLHGFSSHTLTVPPPVAVNAALVPVVSVIPPLKVKVAAALFPVSETPVPDVLLIVPA